MHVQLNVVASGFGSSGKTEVEFSCDTLRPEKPVCTGSALAKIEYAAKIIKIALVTKTSQSNRKFN